MLKLAKKAAKQTYTVNVGDESIIFTVRPAQIGDMDIAYITAFEAVDQNNFQGDTRDQLFSLRAGRSMLLQRIVAWTGVGLPSGDPAPCEAEFIEQFFMEYPKALQQLINAVREWEEAVEKN